MKIIKGKLLVAITLVGALTGMTSCTGMLLSSDFGYDDYGPIYGGGFWPNYGVGYNPALGYYGPAWNNPTPPPPPPQQRPPSQPQRPNGSNRPNYTPPQPSQPSKPQQPSKPAVSTTPDGQMRPGNMGQPAPSGNNQDNQSGISGTHRGR